MPAAVDTGARAKTRPDIPPCYGGLPTAALADEILAGNIRVLFVMGGNPALVFPESEKIRRALRELELLHRLRHPPHRDHRARRRW